MLILLACVETDIPTGPVERVPADPPTFATETLWSDHDDWEPHVASYGGYVYQATTRIGDRARTVVRASDDGGLTWGDDQTLSDEYDAYDPQLAIATDTGCVVFSWLGGPGGWSTYVRTSCDHGATWSDAVAITPEAWTTDHGWLVVSPDGQDVYIAFNGSPVEGTDGIGYVAVSHDGGASFTDVNVAGDGTTRYWFELGGAMAADGTVYIANAEYSEDYTGTANLVLWRSADQGATWDLATVATSDEPEGCAGFDGCTFGFFAAQADVAVDADGALLFVYSANDTAGGPMGIYAVASPGGEDWDRFGVPGRISADATDANFPSVAAGPTAGDFRVVWQAAAAAAWNTWYQRSEDGGGSWLDAPARLSDATDGAPYKSTDGYLFPYGDYYGFAVDDAGTNHVIWGEGPSWSGPGGTWWTSGK